MDGEMTTSTQTTETAATTSAGTSTGAAGQAADFFPDNRHIMSLNHETNTMTIFKINYEKKYFSMWGKPLKVETPNCILVSEIEKLPG